VARRRATALRINSQAAVEPMSKLLLIDLSSLFRPIWEMSGQEADQDHASRATVGAVHAMARDYDHVGIACDSPKSWRKELTPTYKANRPASQEPMLHQLRLAQEQLAKDGFPVWQAEGFEADDVLGAAVAKLKGEHDIIIASSDKDLTQLVEDGDGFSVRVKSLRTGDVMGPDEVEKKFGVRPDQMRDLLALWGDASDGVKGVDGVGQKKGAELIKKHGSLTNIYAKLGDSCTALDLTPNMFSKLKEGEQTAALAWKLVGLRTDVELPFADIFKPRVPQNTDAEFEEEENMGDMADEANNEDEAEARRGEPRVEPKKSDPPPPVEKFEAPSTALALAPTEWSRGLEPRSYEEATIAAKHMFSSKMFQAFGTPQSVLAIILAGRELGLGVMQSLRGFHMVQGKPVMSADLMAALVLNSGKCKQFRCIKTDATKATIRCQRIGDDEPLDVSFTIEEARQAGLLKSGGNWDKYPSAMLVARAKATAARLMFPDVVAGLYTAEEMGREDLEAA